MNWRNYTLSREKFTNDFDYDANEGLDKKKKLIFIVAGLVILALIVIGGIFAKGKMEISSLNKKAENFVEIKDYEEAAKIYSDLYAKTGDVEYKSKKNQMDIMAETKTNMDEAKNLEQQGEYVKAIALYKQIPAEDKDNYKKVSGKTDAEVKQVITREVTSQPSSNLSAANATANSIRNSYQYVTAGEANVRSGPSKSSSSVRVLYKGEEVYVYDTYVESASRIWCKIDGGWISYNTLNGNFR